MTDSEAVSAEEFKERMRPTLDALRTLGEAVEGLDERHGHLPAADSRAMAEIAAESDYSERSEGWQHPIADAHTFGRMTLWAAADSVRTFAAAFAGAEKPPLWGHLVVARAALEASVVATWLNEPDVSFDERVKRALCEIVYSAREVERLGLSPDASKIRSQSEGWAKSLGWTVVFQGRQPAIDGTKRPSVGPGITRLLVSDPEAKIGPAQWSRLSAVSHVTWWGIAWAFDLDAVDQGAGSLRTVPLAADAKKVAMQAFCILRALRRAATDRVAVMGWDDPEWREAVQAAEQVEETLFRAAVGASGE